MKWEIRVQAPAAHVEHHPPPREEEIMKPNYIQLALDILSWECPDLDPELAKLYALLALTLGPSTNLADVHDAWALWRNSTNPTHQSLVPFEELPDEVQELDRPYVEAIKRTARRLANA